MKKTKRTKSKVVKSKKNFKTQMVEYLVSGGAYFWTGYLAFFIFYKTLHWSLFTAKILADVVGWVINYALQRYWVFDNPNLAKHKTEMTSRYLFITAVDFLIDYLIVSELKNIGISPYIGQFVSAGFFTIWNYFWYRFWVFPEGKTRKARA